MNGLGSGDNGEFTFLDLLAMASFFIGLENYDMNLTQDDKQDLMNELSGKAEKLLKEIHNHLAEQDRKMDLILEALNESNREIRKTDT